MGESVLDWYKRLTGEARGRGRKIAGRMGLERRHIALQHRATADALNARPEVVARWNDRAARLQRRRAA